MQFYKNFSLDTADTLLFGISPFSSYYKVEKLFFLLADLKNKKKDIFLFFPDTLYAFNFLQRGFSPDKAEQIVKKQDRYVKNKLLKLIEMLELPSNILIFYSDYAEDPVFLSLYEKYRLICEEHQVFERSMINKSMYHKEFFLREIPFLLAPSLLLKKEKVVFIYRNVPDFIDIFYNILKVNDVNSAFLGFDMEKDKQEITP